MRPSVGRPASLAEYRELLREFDLELVTLYARRRALVRDLWQFKEDRGLPFVDRAQEELVVARARERAVEVGLSAEEGERLLRWILDEGRRSIPRAVTTPLR